MGQYFLVVNTDKKQYLDGFRFGEGIADLQVVSGYHAQALALLTCRMDDVRDTEGTLLGSWSKDLVLAAGEFASPGKYGIETATTGNPDRNLYRMARDEFEDISYQALAILCETHEPICYELAQKASIPRYEKVIFHLGNVIREIGCVPLEQALFEVLGSNWKDRYKAVADYYVQVET